MATNERLLSLVVINEISEDLIHPKAYDAFRRLAYSLEYDFNYGEIGCRFKVYETFRHPWRQAELYRYGAANEKAKPYESAHQFGLAVEFVAFDGGRWSWDKNKPWGALHERAVKCGLIVPFDFSPSHIEHPYWQDLQATLNSM